MFWKEVDVFYFKSMYLVLQEHSSDIVGYLIPKTRKKKTQIKLILVQQL